MGGPLFQATAVSLPMGLVAPAIVLMHVGAGRVSEERKKRLTEALLIPCCNRAIQRVRERGESMEAACQAVVEMEDSGLVNAGRGSNLTISQVAECDASLLVAADTKQSICFAAMGALQRVKNPILGAKSLLLSRSQARREVSYPIILTGHGAKMFCDSAGLAESLPYPEETIAAFYYNKQLLEKLQRGNFPTDTVGCAVYRPGEIAIACSSGGPSLKASGRLGHVPIPFCASYCSTCGNVTVLVMTSGNGEELILSGLPQRLSTVFARTTSIPLLKKALKEDCHYEFGVIACRIEHEQKECSILIAHSTESFGVAYSINSSMSEWKFSTLPLNSRMHLEVFSMHL